MSRQPRQKLKLLYLMKIFEEHTDSEHPLSMPEIIAHLNAYGISAERKCLYDDFEALREFGLDIESSRAKTTGYYLASREFELPELKLLVDAVQSSRFITRKKSLSLIKKIEGLTDRYNATQLQRQVFVSNRIKAMNESIYYNVDYIHNAIAGNSALTFHYFEWDMQKKRRLRRGGELYNVSPWALSWDDENYYMIAFDPSVGEIRHYRVDKMTDITPTGTPRTGRDVFENFDMAVYSRKIFGMFGGEEKTVRLHCKSSAVGVIVDRFGSEVILIPDGEYFYTEVKVIVSPQFIGWLVGLGDIITVVSPDSVIEKVHQHLSKVLEKY